MTVTRRKFLQAVGAMTAAQAVWPTWMPRLAFANDGAQGDVLVQVFLRGGADALNMIVPFGDDDYYRARPTLAIPRPDSGRANAALPLDGFFGLNPDMSALYEVFQAGHMTAVHAVGAPHVSRSHFEAMDLIERGTDGQDGANSGWMGRHLAATSTGDDSPLRAIGWADSLPTSLRGYVSASALRSITDYHLSGAEDDATRDNMQAMLSNLYGRDADLQDDMQATLATLDRVTQINVDAYEPENGAAYTETSFGRALKQTAALIKADAGLEASCIDLGGFDTHITQGVSLAGGIGSFPLLVKELADNLRAFHDDMLAGLDRVTVVVMSEFGRRVQENGAAGTDHGHGGVMLVMNGALQQHAVHGTYPGVNANFLDNGDLQITTDYRDVLGEVLTERVRNANVGYVFPGYTPGRVGLFRG